MPASSKNDTVSSARTATKEGEEEEEMDSLPFLRVLIIMCGCFLAMFLVSLDRTIIGVAIPAISNHFHSVDDIGWYGSAYMLTNASLQLVFGRVYRYNSVKRVYIASLLLFAIGSTLCGAAPSSTVLIVGRAVAGCGAAGIFSGTVQVLTTLVPLHRRPMWMGMMAAIFGVSSILGPLLGGVFTQHLSWRWCFYINLPLCAVSLVVVALLLSAPPRPPMEWRKQIVQLDPIGVVISLGGITSLILALQYAGGGGGGGNEHWKSARVIALLVTFALLLVAFIAWQFHRGDEALVPIRIVSQRTVAGGSLYAFCSSSSMMIVAYYLPIWFQAIKAETAAKSGYMILPFMLSTVVAGIISGKVVQKMGYYLPNLFLAPLLASVGMGLFTTWRPSTGSAGWIGYQVIYGAGIGVGMQGPSLATQKVLKKPDVPIGIAVLFFSQQMGGAVTLAIAENLFRHRLVRCLSPVIANLNGDGMDATKLLASTGVTEFIANLPPTMRQAVVEAYNSALRSVWFLALGFTLALLLALPLIENKSIKQQPKKTDGEAEAGAEEEAEVRPSGSSATASEVGEKA